jgi:lipopolysaccharide transport system permease protein
VNRPATTIELTMPYPSTPDGDHRRVGIGLLQLRIRPLDQNSGHRTHGERPENQLPSTSPCMMFGFFMAKTAVLGRLSFVGAQTALAQMIRACVHHRHLLWQFLQRDISIRYRGTFLGLFWSFLSPLIMLAVYVFVFGFVFKASFGHSANESTFEFGLALFCGLNLFNLFAEVVLRSPTLILQYPNFVKKVVFPLEILPMVAMGTGLFHCLIAFLPLTIGLAIAHHEIPFTVLYLFLFLLPLTLLTCGVSWILAALGVFFRDVQPVLTAAITVLTFMSAVFFPLNAVPQNWRPIVSLNPMVHLIESGRAAIMWGVVPDWRTYFVLVAGALTTAVAGYYVFNRSKSAFADVI